MFGDAGLLAGRDYDAYGHAGLYGRGGRAINRNGYETIPGTPLAPSRGLRFVPDSLQMAENSTPRGVRVVELLADGRNGRDVTADPNLEVVVVGNAASVKSTIQGPLFRPLQKGQAQAIATLGTLTTETPLLIVVGDSGDTLGSLVVSPTPLTIWVGETAAFDSVQFHPGGRHLPFPIDYRLSLLSGQDAVELVGDTKLLGKVPGMAQVVVTSLDRTGRHGETTTVVPVRVVAADLAIQPSPIALRVGQHTPPLTVTIQGGRGLSRQVNATLDSVDPNILAPDPQTPGQFVGKVAGETQIRRHLSRQGGLRKGDNVGETFCQRRYQTQRQGARLLRRRHHPRGRDRRPT